MYNNYFQPQHNGINWVQGLEGAKAYQLMPNSNIVLMDSENDGMFYIKVSNNIGMCSLRKFKYQEIQDTPVANNQYVTKDEVMQMIQELKNEQTISRVARNEQSNKQSQGNK